MGGLGLVLAPLLFHLCTLAGVSAAEEDGTAAAHRLIGGLLAVWLTAPAVARHAATTAAAAAGSGAFGGGEARLALLLDVSLSFALAAAGTALALWRALPAVMRRTDSSAVAWRCRRRALAC